MYKSPIEKIYGEFRTQMVQEDENMVMKTIRKVGVNVDKEELIKALQYDRNQYKTGYEDGKSDVIDKIRAEILDEKEYAYADFEQYKIDYLGVDAEYVEDELPQDDFRYGMERCVEIIDKYRKEQEE